MKRLLTALALLFSAIHPGFSKEQFIYTQISQKEGLTSTVNSIYKEENGDVWIGTPGGLYRFNGYMLRHCEDSVLRNRRVLQTGVDARGDFWVVAGSGIIRRRAGQDDFERVTIPGNDGRQQFYSFCEDSEGLWFGSLGKLYRYSFEQESVSIFLDMTGRSQFLFHKISSIDESTLLCSSHNGIIFVDKVTKDVADAPYRTSTEVSASFVDSHGRVWISFYNNGIGVFDKDGHLLRRYTTENSPLSCNIVLCFTERGSEIWAGTDGGGINIIDFEADEVSSISHIPGDASSFPAHSIKSIYCDEHDNIWAGSVRDGLIRVSRSEMKTYSDTYRGLDNGLSNSTVLFVFQDNHSDQIWIGTDGEGLNRFDPKTGRFTHYPETFGSKVVSVASYSESELVLSLYSDRLCLFNIKTGKLRPLHIDDNDMNYSIRYAGRGVNLANEADGGLLFMSTAVNRYDRKTGKCMKLSQPRISKYTSNYFVAGATQQGIWLHNLHEIHFLPTGGSAMEKILTMGDTSIHSGHIDKDGILWFATNKGLCRFDPSSMEWQCIPTTLFGSAASVICDNDSRIWIGTDNHLFAYLPNQNNFTMFGSSDGAEPNEYLNKSRLLSRSGDIFLGGVQGLLHIDSSFEINASDEPVLGLHEVIVDNERIHIGKSGKYIVPAKSKMLDVQISAQEKDIFREKMFRFCISPGDIIFETHSPTMSVRQLPPAGTYDISVSCSRRDGEWTEPVKLLSMKIPRPWYLTWWFLASAGAFVFLIVLAVFVTIIRSKNNKLRMAMKEQEQKMYEEKVRMLINISHELRTPLTLIMAPLKRLLTEIDCHDSAYPTLGRIYRQSRRMRDLLNMVLDLRKMETGRGCLKLETADFNGWLRESVEDVVCEEKQEGINIVTELDPHIKSVDFDRRKCDTVLMNILINAIKHSSPGDTITISTCLTPEGAVRVSVSDQGPGLKDIDHSKMFTRFYQSNSEEYGSGIGLSYSKILVELHGGRIAAENNHDKGATFWWEIPVRSVETTTEQPERAYLNELMGFNPTEDVTAPESDTFSTANKTLMLVDDSQDLLDFLHESLCSEFREIITATSGNKAMEIIRSGMLPDIIVSDVNMPDGDGFRFCNEIKENEKYGHIPFVLLTARGEQQSQSDSYRMGADGFLAKPFEIETLQELLRGMLRRKEDIRKKYLDTSDEEIQATYGSREERFIIDLNRIISEHLSDPELDQVVLCRELGMSRAALYNKMKSITGSGAKEYITRIRLEQAKSLMENSSLSIAEISDMTGFASQSYFSTAFKAYTGQTPTQYKKSQQ